MTTAAVFLLVLMSAVLVHELAHYAAARSVKLPVRAFSVGMGPILLRRRWRGTEWRLSALPIGGYVDLPGMAPVVDADGKLAHPEEGLAVRPLHHKLWVLVAGVIANAALGILLLASAVTLAPGYSQIVGATPPEVRGTLIVEVVPGSVAERLGIEAGDRLLAIGALLDPTPTESVEAITSADGLELLLQSADGRERRLSVPWPPADLAPGERPRLGVALAPWITESIPFGEALLASASFGVRLFPEMVAGFARGFGAALSGRPNEDVAGPIGMVTMVGQAAAMGLAPVLLMAALINFSLAVFNLLPIPGLDGGRMLLATVVALRGRPFRPGQEETLHFIGIATVLLLIVLISVQEITGLLSS